MPAPEDASCPDCRRSGNTWSPCRLHDPLRQLAVLAADEQRQRYPETAVGLLALPSEAGRDILVVPADLYPEVRRRLASAEDLERLARDLAAAESIDAF